ncbi:hypothetical protein [Spiroplasma endosymbiont of Atherix ibis]|uniref:hypothetical protein n=1 Tax=Spiroplasma endosymbiont of Atherix ibis TaxID=3066291 RepID=UPI0030D17A9A
MKKDSDTYLNYQKIDEKNYEYLRALYVKDNVDSWSSLNNVKKYDLIYGYLNTVYESIENFYYLYYLKQLINKKEIETRERQILENNLKVNKLRYEIKSSNESIIKSIKDTDELFNKKIKLDFYEKIVKIWEVIKSLYIGVRSLTLTAIAALDMTFIPIIGQVAFASGNIVAIAASGMNIALKVETNMLYSKIDENALSIIDSLSFLANIYLFYSKFKPLTENRIIIKSALFLKKVLGLSISLIKAIALITIITCIVQLILVDSSFVKIKEVKNNYIKSISKEINDSIDLAVKEERNKIKEKNNYIYKKTIKIDNIRKENSTLENEVLNIKLLNSNINSDFQIFYNSVKYIPSLNPKKINLIKQRSFKKINNIKNLSLSKLFNELKIKTLENDNNKNKRKVCLEFFDSKYNYSDKKYWKSISNNIIENSFLNLYNVLLK